jgi:hydrogenase maturation protease
MKAAAPAIKSKTNVEKIADAVLYEGYILYPYRASAVKNQQRWNFGAVCPNSYAEAQRGTETSTMQTQCLVVGNSDIKLRVKVRFLHLLLREVAEISECRLPLGECGHLQAGFPGRHFRLTPLLEVNGQPWQTWQEAIEREVVIPDFVIASLHSGRRIVEFNFPASKVTEFLIDEQSGKTSGLIVRTQEAIKGAVEISASRLEVCDDRIVTDRQCFRLTISVRNLTDLPAAARKTRDEALMQSFVSTHTILSIKDGEFVSLLEYPKRYQEAVTSCTNIGTYPVLVGAEGERDCMLSSPIILYDYPQIATESAGDLFDGTEIDEILALRIMSLSDEEKREMRSVDARARQLLDRTESLPAEQFMRLHGVMKGVNRKPDE